MASAVGREPPPSLLPPALLPGPASSCLAHSTCISLAFHTSASLPTSHLQHLQPPQSSEGPFLDAADLVLVQLSVKQRKVVERRSRYKEQKCPNVFHQEVHFLF